MDGHKLDESTPLDLPTAAIHWAPQYSKLINPTQDVNETWVDPVIGGKIMIELGFGGWGLPKKMPGE